MIIFTITESEHYTFTIKTNHLEFQHLNQRFVEHWELFETMQMITETINNEHHKTVLFEVE